MSGCTARSRLLTRRAGLPLRGFEAEPESERMQEEAVKEEAPKRSARGRRLSRFQYVLAMLILALIVLSLSVILGSYVGVLALPLWKET